MITSTDLQEGELLVDSVYTLNDICEICRLDLIFVAELIEYEIITPADTTSNTFSHTQLNRAMKAWRLQRDLELNPAGVALVMQLLEKIDQQEKELKLLRQLITP